MADQIKMDLLRYQNLHINMSQSLGHGSYGAVYKAKRDQLLCVAKVLHPTIPDPSDPGAGKIMQRFQQECVFLESIRHPHIVQYLGMITDPESRLPVLLMELLDESLTKMLESSKNMLAYYTQVNICHDIASAVAYLHSNEIIHRDLSSNNVLIMAKSRAKVTDFGMSKLADSAPTMTPLTTCPGTLAYMPPEALEELPRYTKKLDCFSQGVIMIQVCTRLWPEPGPRTKAVSDSRSPTGMTQMPVLESERRKNHIDKIACSHALLPIAMDCLHYQESERPSSEELCQRLADLEESRMYRESMQQVERVQNDIAELEKQIGEMQVQKVPTVQQLHDEIQKQYGEIQQLRGEILSKDVQLHQQERQLRSQKRQTQHLNKQLEEQELVTAELQQRNNSLQILVEQLQQQLSQQTQQKAKPTQPLTRVPLKAQVRGRQVHQDHSMKVKQSQPSLQQVQLQKPHPPTGQPRLILEEWRDGGRAPFGMARGNAVVDGNVAYFMNYDGEACSYNSTTKRWSKLPMCPHRNSCLAVIRGLLTAIGGENASMPGGSDAEKRLISIVNDKNKKWVEYFYPMRTKRYFATAVTTKQHLIVAGGQSGELSCNYLNTVEVMDIQTLLWSTAASLPHPYISASATICRDHLYILGGFYSGSVTPSVLTCSLTKLLQSCSGTLSNSVWSRITDVPVRRSTCAAVNGELVAVGGLLAGSKTTAAVHKYNPTTNSWDLINNMPTARFNCLAAVLPTNQMMVVGGYRQFFSYLTDKVEIASITCS